MAHRYFKNQNRPPISGWVGEVTGVPGLVKGTSFSNLVGKLGALASANGLTAPYEDEVAMEACRRNPGFCWAKITNGRIDGTRMAVQKTRRGCGSCGGGSIR